MTSSLPAEGDRIERSPDEWREQLTPEQFQVARQGGTERAFTGAYWNHKDDGLAQFLGWGELRCDPHQGGPHPWDGAHRNSLCTM